MERLRQSLQESGAPARKSSRAGKTKKKTASARKKKAA
jgi:hypothetical protein